MLEDESGEEVASASYTKPKITKKNMAGSWRSGEGVTVVSPLVSFLPSIAARKWGSPACIAVATACRMVGHVLV